MVIEPPRQNFVTNCADLRVKMRINDLCESGLVFRDREWITDQVALGVSQPGRRLVAFQHQHSALRLGRPDVLFFHSRVEFEHRAQSVFVQTGKPYLQFVTKLFSFESKNNPFRRLLSSVANTLTPRPKHAGSATFLCDGTSQLALR